MKERYLTAKIGITSLAMAIIAVLPVLIVNGGNLFLVGDYMTQQIPFIRECRRMLLSGAPFWSHNTFLGANFLGAYSFYNWASPFFLPLFLLPEKDVAFGAGVMLIIKLSVAAMTASLYLKKHIRTPHLVFTGALIYAFSSFTLDSTFFYHFIDVIAVFPLLLYCTDEVLEGRKKALLSLAVMLNACVNYYFFFISSVFFLIYLFFRVHNGKYSWKDTFRCIVFYALGAFSAMFTLLPSAFSLFETYKVSGSFADTFVRGLSSIPQLFKTLKGIILPSEGIMGSAMGFRYSVFNSNNAFLPFFGAVFTFTALRKKSGEWYYKLIKFLFILTLVPFGNGIFSLFTNVSYTRWWYAFVLIQVLVSVKIIEEYETEKPKAIIEYRKSVKTITKIALAVVGCPILAKLLMAYVLKDFASRILPAHIIDYLTDIGITEKFNAEDLRYMLVLVFLYAISFVPLYTSVKNGWLYKAKRIIPAVILICTLNFGVYFINETDIADSGYEDSYMGMDAAVKDGTNYTSRTDYSYSLVNYPMVANTLGTTVFHSFKSKATAEFCKLVGYEDTLHASSKKYFDTPAVQTLLSIETLVNKEGVSTPAEYYTPFGWVYDYYVIDEGFEYTTDKAENNRHIELMTKACIVDRETAEKIKDNATLLESTDSVDWKAACKNNKRTAATDISLTSRGLSCVTSGEKERLIYFSLPNDNGWKAYINGEEAEILTLNGGMMGIIVPEGEAQIRLEFHTPGFMAGIIVSILSLAIVTFLQMLQKRNKNDK